MKYEYSSDWTIRTRDLAKALALSHVDTERVSVIVSQGSKSRRTIARIHTMGKAMQTGMLQKPFYTIELISEKFFRQSQDDQTKTLIHELLHIPASFGGGFRHHKTHVNHHTVEKEFNKIVSQKRLF
ncbi:MAG: putative metallopeptidase [archaeon]|nr:putative metallopeptidase [archaeon]